MTALESQIFRFAGFELEPGERRLSRGGRLVPLTPKVFELLVLMVGSGGRVLSKDDLMAALWPGRFVMESNLTKHVWLLRKALGGDADGEGCIQTVSKAGYRFVAPVTLAAAGEAPAFAVGAPRLPWAKVRAAVSRRPRAWAACALAALAALAAAWVLSIRVPDASPADRRGAAISLPAFDNLSRSPREAWVGPALAEILGTEIGLSGGPRVIPGELTRPAQGGLPAPARAATRKRASRCCAVAWAPILF